MTRTCGRGLAASFNVDGSELERFYHFWYNKDRFAVDLIKGLGLEIRLIERPSKTGMYFAGSLTGLPNLSTCCVSRRFRSWIVFGSGLSTLAERSRRDGALDKMSAADWLRKLGGERVFKVVWEPLLLGKFGSYAYDVSAAWFWSKLVLRGSSRNDSGREAILYLKGGFALALAEKTC